MIITPTLEKVRRTDGNNDICMCICDIYLEISKIVSLEGIANKILPNLISMLIKGNITKSNFFINNEINHDLYRSNQKK